VREVSGNSEAGSVLALGVGGLSIEASSNLEKRKCPWAYECEPAVEHAGSYVCMYKEWAFTALAPRLTVVHCASLEAM
jgi:hypothetical protein